MAIVATPTTRYLVVFIMIGIAGKCQQVERASSAFNLSQEQVTISGDRSATSVAPTPFDDKSTY